MRHQMSNKKCHGICQKITVNGLEHRLDDRICTNIGGFSSFARMWQRQKGKGHQMTDRPLLTKSIRVEPENATQSSQIPCVPALCSIMAHHALLSRMLSPFSGSSPVGQRGTWPVGTRPFKNDSVLPMHMSACTVMPA